MSAHIYQRRNGTLGSSCDGVARRLMDLPPEQRQVIHDILADLVSDARSRAQTSWRQNKGPMAAYWKAVGAYAHHLRRLVKP